MPSERDIRSRVKNLEGDDTGTSPSWVRHLIDVQEDDEKRRQERLEALEAQEDYPQTWTEALRIAQEERN